MVLALHMACASAIRVAGPMSRPNQPGGIPDSTVAFLMSEVKDFLLPILKSTGRWIFTPRALAFWSTAEAASQPRESYSLSPIFIPLATFRKVKAIAPLMIISSTLSSMLRIALSLSCTRTPPKNARQGLAGLSSIFEKVCSSLCTSSPTQRTGRLIFVIEVACWWQAAKASLTKTSPREERALANSSICFGVASIRSPS
mmetsp:Transcript_18229/g.35665  ORF Transcript_18229/g.35665 Transcript_18229/m.35665 type:complete len:200 (-) Transcript_18229:417-1016(-)